MRSKPFPANYICWVIIPTYFRMRQVMLKQTSHVSLTQSIGVRAYARSPYRPTCVAPWPELLESSSIAPGALWPRLRGQILRDNAEHQSDINIQKCQILSKCLVFCFFGFFKDFLVYFCFFVFFRVGSMRKIC